MKAREVREKLRGKIDPDLLVTLEAFAIQLGNLEKMMAEAVSMCQMTAEIAEGFNAVADGMKKKLTQLESMQMGEGSTKQ